MSEPNPFVNVDPEALGKHQAAGDFIGAIFDESPNLQQIPALPQARVDELATKHNIPPGEANALAYLSRHEVARSMPKFLAELRSLSIEQETVTLFYRATTCLRAFARTAIRGLFNDEGGI
jgi:hypothetical protein